MQGKSLHDKHKQRMRERFINSSDFTGFSQHEILEILLSYSIVRKNTNDIAHRLIARFGSLNDVLRADVKDLCTVDGVGERTAVFLNMQYALIRFYNSMDIEGARITGDVKEAALKRLRPLFERCEKEMMYLVTINNKDRIKHIKKIADGSITSVMVAPRVLVKECIDDNNIVAAIIAHNHPGGRAFPSQADLNFTKLAQEALGVVDITLLEHYIICDDNYYPIMASNIIVSDKS